MSSCLVGTFTLALGAILAYVVVTNPLPVLTGGAASCCQPENNLPAVFTGLVMVPMCQWATT